MTNMTWGGNATQQGNLNYYYLELQRQSNQFFGQTALAQGYQAYGNITGLSNISSVATALRIADSPLNSMRSSNPQIVGVGMPQYSGSSSYGNTTANDLFRTAANNLYGMAQNNVSNRFANTFNTMSFFPGTLTGQDAMSYVANSIFPGGSYQGHTTLGSYAVPSMVAASSGAQSFVNRMFGGPVR